MHSNTYADVFQEKMTARVFVLDHESAFKGAAFYCYWLIPRSGINERATLKDCLVLSYSQCNYSDSLGSETNVISDLSTPSLTLVLFLERQQAQVRQ